MGNRIAPQLEPERHREVTIRMYHPGGIGDCFLLTFPREDGGVFTMLIDCGVLQSTPKARERMQEIVEDIVQTTEGELDVLVVTHQHWDHISGFYQAEEIFRNQLKVKQVWFGWLENPADQRAKELAEKKRKILKQLTGMALQLKNLSTDNYSKRRAQSVISLFQNFYAEGDLLGADAVSGRITSQKIMELVRSFSINEPEYLKPGGTPLALPGVASARVFVFGPPDNFKYLFTPDAKHGLTIDIFSQLLAAVSSEPNAGEIGPDSKENLERSLPFGGSAGIRLSNVEKLDRSKTRTFIRRYLRENRWQSIDLDWMWTVESLAIDLDSNTNNTSLALAIEVGREGKVLFFPGDAQTGNWLSWQELEFPAAARVPDAPVKARDLIRRTVFYKVGHHGSHNATLCENGLDLMNSDQLVAMIPVNREQAKQEEWEMPARPLFAELRKKTRGRVILADSGLPEPEDGQPTPPEAFRPQIVSTFNGVFYIEYRIPYEC